ncbi:MAG: response regulator [Deltaproteobacteria bacterium]|nr:response regulator [Deltaproteobacteria bacterium]
MTSFTIHILTLPSILFKNAQFFRLFKQAFQTGEYTHIDSEVLWRADGTSFPAEYWSYPIIEHDQITGGVVTFFDITERKQAEDDLKSRTHDLGERVKELHCLYNISKIAEEGDLSIEETTQRIVNLIPPTWQYSDITCARIILQGKEFKTEDFEASVWKQTSDIKVFSKIIGTLDVYYSEEKPTDFEGPFLKEERDLIEAISERLGRIIGGKQAEEEKQKVEAQLVQAQKMEAIGTLAGGIAHDFNNILSAILGHCDLAKMKLAEDSEAIDNLNRVKNAGARATRLIQQILAFGRMGEQEMIPLSLTPLIKEALKFIRSTLPTSIEIRDYIEADPGIIEADTTQIHQIVMNLCTNAGHAMQEEGGTLDVKLIRVEVDRQTALQHHELHTGPHVRLMVSDTGYGMDSETLEHIFDPYFTTKEKGEGTGLGLSVVHGGTGLGLSVVHGIVKTHNGVITVESEPGKGTAFHVYFPVIEKDAETQEEDEGPLPTGNERILFVDDEEMIVDIAKEMLGKLGYDIVTEKSVITDMTMPKMTGDQLARELMKVRPDIPIILCTGFNPKISEEKSKELGIKAFAMKPLLGRDMANTIRKALD